MRGGIDAEACPDVQSVLRDHNSEPIGPLLIAEECLLPGFVQALSSWLQRQPEWSDLPILILTTSGRETDRTRQLERERLPLGSPVLLERPIRQLTLLSSVQAAVRARKRQYEMRAAFEALDRAVAELKTEQETLRTLVNTMPVGVLLAKPSGEIVLGNPAAETIFGHSLKPTKDVAGHGEWVSYHPDGRRVQAEEYPLVRAIRSGQAVPGEHYLYERGDGKKVWIRLAAAPVMNEAGEVAGGVVAISDVDEERRAAEALGRSEERFRLLVEQASVGVVIGDLSGRLTYMNPAILRLLGYTQEEMEAGLVRWDELTPPEYREADQHAIEQLRATGVAQPYQKAYLARDGRAVPLLVGAVSIPSAKKDDPQEVAVFLTDMSSQKQAETALIQSEKLAAVGRLAASISHEINNPLEAVTNLLYLAASENVEPQVKQYLDMAAQELARVSQIVGQTLRFHRQSTKPRTVTPQELLDSVLALYQGRMLNAKVQAVTDYRGAPEFIAYEGDIRQVLNNLVGNAIDAMRGDGTLCVRSRAAVDAKTGVPGVRITVGDTGHGMDAETVRHIFEPFYTTKGIHGTGLGLWISKGIVEKHHGKLRVWSSTGGHPCGTVFSLFLPLDPHMSEAAA